ncbi:MAG: hypothetical protein IPM13_19810 [Phycisphaerales bacterium]|nr:hypothetical protein [Phycisphaerales bacterium]
MKVRTRITQAEYHRLYAFFRPTADDVGVGSALPVDVPDATRLGRGEDPDPGDRARVQADLARVTPHLEAAREAWLARAREAVGATGAQLSAWRAVGALPAA